MVMLHPSPMSSAFLEPVMTHLEDLVSMVAADTPGYGQSDPLPVGGDGLSPYLDWLELFLDAMGLERTGLYGSATGAQIAIEFAKRRPERCKWLVLENAVHFTDEERAEIMANYFPDITPRADGSHLATAWAMSDGLFRQFPWFSQRPEDRVKGPGPPPGFVHATVLAYLTAGPDYDRAYRAAFNNEKAERLAEVPVPTAVMRWGGSLLKKQADRFDDYPWPEHIRMVHSGPSPEERFAALREAVKTLAQGVE